MAAFQRSLTASCAIYPAVSERALLAASPLLHSSMDEDDIKRIPLSQIHSDPLRGTILKEVPFLLEASPRILPDTGNIGYIRALQVGGAVGEWGIQVSAIRNRRAWHFRRL